MKYMTFNFSCSFAGVANMLAQYGIETTDRDIALTMKLPFLFAYADGAYLSGPMLQSAGWFDLYLNPLGYRLVEKWIPAGELADYLKAQTTAMIGIRMEDAGKHAVVYNGRENHRFVFINNKWEDENSPERIFLDREELVQRVDAEVAVATLQQISPRNVDFLEKLGESITVLRDNVSEIKQLCHTEVSVVTLHSKLNTLFRPLFLDGITMLNMIGEAELAGEFALLQQGLLTAIRQEAEQNIILKEYICIEKLEDCAEKYIALIRREADALTL